MCTSTSRGQAIGTLHPEIYCSELQSAPALLEGRRSALLTFGFNNLVLKGAPALLEGILEGRRPARQFNFLGQSIGTLRCGM